MSERIELKFEEMQQKRGDLAYREHG